MTSPAGRAAVEILGDTRKFAQQLQRDLDRALRDVRLNLQPLSAKLEKGVAEAAKSFDKLDDAATNALGDVATTADRAFDEIARDAESSFSKVGADVNQLGERIGQEVQAGGEVAERAFDELRRSAVNDLEAISRQAAATAVVTGGRLHAGLAALGPLFLGLAAAAGAGLVAITGFGLKAAADLEQTRVSFDALTGSAAAGEAVFKELQQFAAVTPFEFPQLATAAKRFLAFNDAVGLSDDKLFDFLTALGDVASVTGAGAEGMDRVALAIGQIASTGKVTLDNLNQISEALPGFSGVAAIASATGMTTAETMEAISAGEISAAEGVQALIEGMKKFPGAAGAMEAQAQTLLGVFSTFKDTITQALVGGFTPVIPEIKAALTDVTPVLGEAIAAIAPVLGQALTGLLPLLASLIKGIVPILEPVVAGISQLIKAVSDAGVLEGLGKALGSITQAALPMVPVLAEVAVALGEALIPVIAELAPVIAEMAPAFAALLLALIPLLPSISSLVVSLLQLVGPLAQLVGFLAELLANKAVVPIVAALAFVVEKLAEAIGAVAGWIDNIDWGATAEAIGGFFADAWENVLEFFGGIGNFFANLPGQIGGFLASLPGLIGGFFARMFEEALRTIGRGIGLILALIVGFPDTVLFAIQVLLPRLLGFFGGLFTSLKGQVLTGLGEIGAFFAALPGRIGGFLLALPGLVRAAFVNTFNAARNAVLGGIANIVGLIQSLPGRIGAFRNQLFSSGLNLIRGFIDGLERVGGFVGDLASKIVNSIKGFLNRVIDSINSGIGDIDNALPISLPRLPRLQRGGLTTREGIAALHSRELVLPLEDRRATDLLARALSEADEQLRGLGVPTFSQGDIEVRVFIGDRELTDIVDVQISERDRELKRRVGAGPRR